MGLNEINTVLFMSKTSKIQCMKFNSVNGTHVEDVKFNSVNGTHEDIKIHVFLSFAAIRTVARGHELVAQGWAAFEKTCTEVGVGELPQLLQYVKTHTTPTPTATPVKEVKEEEPMDVAPVKRRNRRPSLKSPFMLVSGGKQLSTGVVTVTLPLKSQKQAWMPTFEVCTQRRLCCAPSVRFLRTTSIR